MVRRRLRWGPMTVLSADHCEPLFYTCSHHTTPRFFGVPLLDQPRVVRIPRTTGTILAFVVGHSSFGGLDFGFGRYLPRIRGRQQLKPFLEIHHVRHRPTLHLASTSGRSAFAFASRGHPTSTLATHGFGDSRRQAPGFIASRASTPSTGSATSTATASAGWYRGWTWAGRSRRRAAHRRSPSLFIHGGHRIGMRDIANTSPSSPFLRIFVQQIQPSP